MPMRSLPLAVLVLLSSLLQIVIFPMTGPLPTWRADLAWVAFVPFLVALWTRPTSGRGIWRSALLGYATGVLWYLGTCYWVYSAMHIYGGIGAAASVGILTLFALYLGLYHALFGALTAILRRRFTPMAAVLLTPFLWIAVEIARARITSFPWDLLGYSQVDNLWLSRMARITGVYGLSFAVMLGNSLIACWFVAAGRARRVLAVTGLAMASVCAILGLVSRPAPVPAPFTAVLLQPNLNAGVEERASDAASMISRFADRSLHPGNGDTAGVSAVLWPESPAPFQAYRPEFRSALAALSTEDHATVIAGAVGVDFDNRAPNGYRIYNSAAVFSPSQGFVRRYDKIHLVPFGEFVPYADVFAFAKGLTQAVGMFDRGKERESISSNGHRYGIFLCYESIFGDEVRQFTEDGAQVLVNLSDDGWYGDTSAPFQHLNMARMRAIENGRWLLRDTNTGVTASIDPYGRVVQTTARHVFTALAVHFAYLDSTTFYTRHGDVFAYVCTLIAVAVLLVAAQQKQVD